MDYSDIELPTNRKFGFFFTVVFALLGFYLFINNFFASSYISFGLASILLLVTLLNDQVLHPLNKLWMRFGILLGTIVSPIVFGIIFFGIFTPVSLMTKLFGRDELRLRSTWKASHWRERAVGSSQRDNFKYQF